MIVRLQASSNNGATSFGKCGIHLSRLFREMFHDDGTAAPDLQVYLGTPCYQHRRHWRRIGRRFVWFTMHEWPQVPAGDCKRLNDSDGIIVPSSFVDGIYADKGLRPPRFTVPLGVDVESYRFRPRPRRKEFTFLWMGTTVGYARHLTEYKRTRTGDRKRGWLVREAFERLNLPNARLILKSQAWPNPPRNFRYGNVWDVGCWMPEADLKELFFQADILVWPTWGEGFGLPPLEMAATGIPTIMPRYSGMADYWDENCFIGLPYEVGRIWRTASHTGAVIRIEDLMEKMVWAYEHREQVREMGCCGVTLARQWSWQDKTRPALHRAINHYAEE